MMVAMTYSYDYYNGGISDNGDDDFDGGDALVMAMMMVMT